MILLTVSLLAVVFASQPSAAWPTSDGAYYVMNVPSSNAPKIDGKNTAGEWNTKEEVFKDTWKAAISFPQGSVPALEMQVAMLTDGTNLFVKVTYVTNVVTSTTQNNSIGLAFSKAEPHGMQDTYDRKVAYWDATAQKMNNTDLFNCFNYNDPSNTFCAKPGHLTPGVPDQSQNFDAMFGVSDGVGFFEYKIPMQSDNATEDITIGEGTYLNIVVNPYADIAAPDVGHGAVSSDPLKIQFEPRCYFCQPAPGITGNALVFNVFFALLISGIYLTLIYSGRSESFAAKLWKVDVTEDMAKESVLMEMAYYNSSFISILVSAFFLMYSIIGFIYGIWAQWAADNVAIYGIYGIPIILGVVTIMDLLKRNQNPQDMKTRPGTDYTEAGKFWLVPTLFLAITLLMLVFIGIDVIAG